MSKKKPTVSNGDSTVKWVSIIVSILILFFSAAYGAVHTKLIKHDDLIMKISVDIAEIKSDVKYIRQQLEEQ